MFKYAISLVFRRKLRTFLTSLGITISAILLSLIIFGMQGLSDVLTNEFTTRFNPNQLILSNQDLSLRFRAGTAEEVEEPKEPVFITPGVLEQIEEEDFVQSSEPVLTILGMQIELVNSKLAPFDPGFVQINGIFTVENTSFLQEYIGDKFIPEGNEIIIGNRVAEYFGLLPEDIIGRDIIVKPSTTSFAQQKSAELVGKEFRYTVIGFGDSGVDSIDAILSINQAASLLAEIGGFNSASEYLNTFGYDQVIVEVDGDRIDEAREVLENEYGIYAISSEDLLSFLDQITSILTLSLVMFGLISAIVASIGIINTMVMSIYEQTREIGIIKAIGASNFQVLIIFLIQAGMIGFIGSILGLAVVFLVTLIADPIIIDLLQEEGFTATNFFSLDPAIILTIILVSIFVGILAGLYPALKAARLDPVRALRYE